LLFRTANPQFLPSRGSRCAGQTAGRESLGALIRRPAGGTLREIERAAVHVLVPGKYANTGCHYDRPDVIRNVPKGQPIIAW